MGLSAMARHIDSRSPLLEGIERSGRVELRPGLIVECGRTFVWWQKDDHAKREIMRVVMAAPEGAMPARIVVVDSRGDEHVVFSDEIELWAPPKKRSPFAARRLRQLVGDPLS